MNLWSPERIWAGEDAFLIGGGPSLLNFDFSRLQGLNTIGCNDAFRLGGGVLKFLIFGDKMWWERNKHQLLAGFSGRIVTNCPSLQNTRVDEVFKMARERDGIHSGHTLGWNYSTGAAAINLAISLGAARIFLLGYDLSNAAGRSHWHQHNPKVIREDSFQRYLEGFQMVRKCLPEGVRVLNVTDGSSKLDCFETIDHWAFESVLPGKEVLPR